MTLAKGQRRRRQRGSRGRPSRERRDIARALKFRGATAREPMGIPVVEVDTMWKRQ